MRGRRTIRPTASFKGRSTSRAAAPDREPSKARSVAPAGKADFVLVLKKPRRLLLLRGDRVLRDYEVALGKSPDGPKRHYLDGRTPEGRYAIDGRVEDSEFHRALHISYPNASDREFALRAGVAAGDGVMIHGLPNGKRWVGETHRGYDWTNGCIAVTDDEMDEIWELVDDGTPIEIRP
jgi:murein L,D-transpeptidase YafK